MDSCNECLELSDDLFFALCPECWEKLEDDMGLGVRPFTKPHKFDDE